MMRSTKELRHVYRDFLLEANQSYSDIVVLEADLSSSMATNNLEKDFGDRYVNVGIMEAEMVGLAAGLSIQGFRPYLHTFGLLLHEEYLINYLFLLDTHNWMPL